MKKVKIYLDTSVISHILAEDTPEKMEDTHKLWAQIKYGKYEVCLSETTLDEVSECPEPKRTTMYRHLAEIQFSRLTVDEETEQLAQQLISLGVLTQKSMDDCIHIAAAVLANCDYIVSWNFKHMVNIKTINGVRAITNLAGYRSIDITSPTMMIGDDDNSEAEHQP